jgi:hypothetical protein
MAEPAELDARVIAAFTEDAESDDVGCVIADVEAAAKVASADAGEARAQALDPLIGDVIAARQWTTRPSGATD